MCLSLRVRSCMYVVLDVCFMVALWIQANPGSVFVAGSSADSLALRAVLIEHAYCKPAMDSTDRPSADTSCSFLLPEAEVEEVEFENNDDSLEVVSSVPDVGQELEIGLPLGSCNVTSSSVLSAFAFDRSTQLQVAEKTLSLSSRQSRVEMACRLGELENDALLKDCQQAIKNAANARTLDSVLGIPEGQLTTRKYNPVVTAFVENITSVKEPGSKSASDLGQLRRQSCIETLYSARHLKYTSEFFLSTQAIVYAICGSKAVVDIIGHLGPGSSYQLLTEWLREMASEKAAVPAGFVTVGFDNEQRLLKNWLARGSNRSTIEVFTNIVCVAHNEHSSMQNEVAFHPRSWRKSSSEELCALFENVAEPLNSDLTRLPFSHYLEGRIAALSCAGRHDDVAKLAAAAERDHQFLNYPSCGTLVERRLRNCPNADCSVSNVRAALAKEQGSDVVSTEHVRAPRRATVRPGTVFSYSIEQSSDSAPLLRRCSSSSGQCSSTGSSTTMSASVSAVARANVLPVEPLFVNPNSHEALRRLLQHIGSECGVRSAGGHDREWVTVCCDGLPYNLMRHVINESRQRKQDSASACAGIPNVATLQKAALKVECSKRGLSELGSVAELKQRLQCFIDEQLSTGAIILPPPQEGEYDWVVCQTGPLHWEMKLVQSVVDVMWAFVYEAFVTSQGYTTPRQMAWQKAVKTTTEHSTN